MSDERWNIPDVDLHDRELLKRLLSAYGQGLTEFYAPDIVGSYDIDSHNTLTERETMSVNINVQVFGGALGCVSGIVKNVEEDVDEFSQFPMILEFLYVMHQLLLRAALGRGWPSEDAYRLMDEVFRPGLFVAVGVLLGPADAENITEIQKRVLAEYAQSGEVYSECKIEADEDEGLDGTLFWEFGKNMARLAGQENDILPIVIAANTAGEALQRLAMDEFFTQYKAAK